MALEKTFRELPAQLRRLGDRLQELEVTVVEDRPAANGAAIVDSFEYAVDDLRGWVEEALQAAEEAEQAVGHPVDIGRARHALTICQERFHRIEKGFAANLVSYDCMKDLAGFSSERRGEFPSWATSVKQGVEHCMQPLEDAGKALAECWQEIAERVGMTSVSVQATNIGQKIVTKAAEGARLVGEGVT
jgi:hypothetical protein